MAKMQWWNNRVEVVDTYPELGLALAEFYLTLPIEVPVMFDNNLLALLAPWLSLHDAFIKCNDVFVANFIK